MRSTLLTSLFVLVCGAFAGWWVAGLVPPPPLPEEDGIWQDDYRFERHADKTFEISAGHWLRVPRLFADFDLQMDVELAEGTDLDLLVRHVEPRLVQKQLLPFQARFAALRLSTGRPGPAWLSREQALLGPHGSGADLAPGLMATVWLQGRGRLLRANVAGKWLPWFQADDEYGMFTLIAHGGKAVLHRFVVENLGQPRAWLWSRWFWVLLGSLGGALVAAAALTAQAGVWRTLLAGVCLAGLVWLLRGEPVVAKALSLPAPAALLGLLGGASAFVALLLLVCRWRRPWLAALLVAVVGAGWALLLQAGREDLRLHDAVVDELFGPGAGNTSCEAHAQLVRGPFELHDPSVKGARVFLLGGQLLYGRNAAPEEHLEPLLRGQLRAGLQQAVDVPCLPTIDGYSAQQWRLFTTFFTGYHPKVIVFGVPRDEAAIDETTHQPRSSPTSLAATLQAVQEYCVAQACQLVLFTEEGLPPELLAVLQKAVQADVPMVVAGNGEAPVAVAKKLAAVLLPLLR